MRTIYLDESGHGGSNFLDSQKPLFVVASQCIEPDEASDLKQRFFGSVSGGELKHSRLVRRPRQREMILAFLSHVAARPDIAKVWLIDKGYAAWLKVVDHVVEPFVHAQGGNLYDRGANLAMTTRQPPPTRFKNACTKPNASA